MKTRLQILRANLTETTKSVGAKLVFRSAAFAFFLRLKVSSVRKVASISRFLLGQVARTAVQAGLLLLILELLEHYAFKYVSFLPRSIASPLIQAHDNYLSTASTLVGSLLAAAASIAGVFLGLYLAVVTVVAGALFTRVPAELRLLVVRDKYGVHYLRSLGYLASFSLLALALNELGSRPGMMTLTAAAFLALYAIGAFLWLGLRAFNLFDPRALIQTALEELQDTSRRATIDGFRWHDERFQRVYRAHAWANITTVRSVIEYARSQVDWDPRALAQVIEQIIYSISAYSRLKWKIPSQSEWFLRVPRYERFFESNSTALMTYYRTFTQPPPKMVSHSDWLEESLRGDIVDSVKDLCNGGKLTHVAQVLQLVHKFMRQLGSDLETTEGIEWVRDLKELAEHVSLKSSSEQALEPSAVAVVEACAASLTHLALGVFDFIRATDVAGVRRSLDEINWRQQKAIYQSGMPPGLLPSLESLTDGLRFERRVEGRELTASWYRYQLFVTQSAHIVTEKLVEVINLVDSVFVEPCQRANEKEDWIKAAIYGQRGLAHCWRLERNIPEVCEKLEAFKVSRTPEYTKWPVMDPSMELERIRSQNAALVLNVARALPGLAKMTRTTDLPDYFGDVYQTVQYAVFDAAAQGNAEDVKSLFKPFFLSGMVLYQDLVNAVHNKTATMTLKGVFEPLMDVLEISGYCKILSDLKNIPEVWQTCMTSWKEYLEASESPIDELKKIVNAYNAYSGALGITPSTLSRSQFGNRLREELEQAGLIDRSPVISSVDRRKINHASPLIRAIARSTTTLNTDPALVFFLALENDAIEYRGLEVNDRWDFKGQLKREEDSQ